jgi:hypothetical protein
VRFIEGAGGASIVLTPGYAVDERGSCRECAVGE